MNKIGLFEDEVCMGILIINLYCKKLLSLPHSIGTWEWLHED